ncbi:MAG: GNAT family N-acetyltransferase [Promethearchaeota archaeon]
MIKGKHVTLRGLEKEDVKEIMRHWNDLEIRRFIGNPYPVAKEEEEQWIQNTWESRRKGTELIFGIEINEGSKLIGTISLNSISRIHRFSELGIAIWNKKYWGQGLGTEAIHLILDYAFKTLNLHSIYLTVIEDNERAQRAYKKVGFQQVGRRRQTIYLEGKYQDLLIMDILATEYRGAH